MRKERYCSMCGNELQDTETGWCVTCIALLQDGYQEVEFSHCDVIYDEYFGSNMPEEDDQGDSN